MSWIVYIIFGILLFFLLVICGRKYNFTKINNIIFTIIYFLIISGVFIRCGFNSINDNIFMIGVVELFCQLIYISYILDKDFFNKNDKYFSFYIIKIILLFILNKELINKVSDVFLSGNDLKTIVWLLLIVYLYQFFKERDIKIVYKNDDNISRENIIMSYAKLKLKYDEDVVVSGDNKKLVIYSIMIFNNYNKPSFFRKIDNILFKFDNKPRKLGIMQIKSKKYINDYESIVSAVKKVEKLYEKTKKDTEVISLYDKENSKDILFIYDELKKFCKI